MIEQLDLHALRIIHPVCGSVLLLTDVQAYDDMIEAEGICYRCDRYIHAEIRMRIGVGEMSGRHEKQVLRLALIESGQNVAKAARILNISRKTVYARMKKWGLVL